jgi:hypothetical protein
MTVRTHHDERPVSWSIAWSIIQRHTSMAFRMAWAVVVWCLVMLAVFKQVGGSAVVPSGLFHPGQYSDWWQSWRVIARAAHDAWRISWFGQHPGWSLLMAVVVYAPINIHCVRELIKSKFCNFSLVFEKKID